MPQIVPLLTLMLVRTWYEESTPLGLLSLKNIAQNPSRSHEDEGHFTHKIESP